VVRARPDIMVNGLNADDFTWNSKAAHTILVPATPKQVNCCNLQHDATYCNTMQRIVQ